MSGTGPSRRVAAALITAAVLVHGAGVGLAWRDAQRIRGGKDFASYHYAAVVAHEGGDPYDTPLVMRRARVDGRRLPLNPYFYPPPFLLLVAWSPHTSLDVAYRIWFWISEVAALIAVGATARLLRPLSPWAPTVTLVAVAVCSAFTDNLRMGQANFVVLAATLVGLLAARRPTDGAVLEAKAGGDEIGAGVALGLACMWKMSPALFVLHALVQRRWAVVVASVVCAVVWSFAALPVLDAAHQWLFYRKVLPGFSTGDYNGLIVPITLFGNHSIPNLYAQLFPGNGSLGLVARILSFGTAIGMVTGTMLAFRTAADEAQRVAQIAAIAVLMLLIPVYTYEHHVVWAVPAVVVGGTALIDRRLPRWVAAPYLLAVFVWGLDLGAFKWASARLEFAHPWLALGPQEAKFVALVVLFAIAAHQGARASAAVARAPAPDASAPV